MSCVAQVKNELLRLMALHKALIAPVNNVAVKFGREFEVSGVDVVLSVSAGSNEFVKQPDWWQPEYKYFWHHGYWSQSFEIELKPIIGDDYPTVLRQMKANKSAVLFVGEYTGQGCDARAIREDDGNRRHPCCVCARCRRAMTAGAVAVPRGSARLVVGLFVLIGAWLLNAARRRISARSRFRVRSKPPSMTAEKVAPGGDPAHEG
jgi:hypothetical protein